MKAGFAKSGADGKRGWLARNLKEHFSLTRREWRAKAIAAACIFLLAVGMIYIFGQLYDRPGADEYLVYDATIGETPSIGEKDTLMQTFTSPFDTLRVISLSPVYADADVNVMYVVRLYADNELLFTNDFKTQETTGKFNICPTPVTDAKGKLFRIEITVGRTTEGKSIPFDLMPDTEGFDAAMVNGQALTSPLAVDLNTAPTGQAATYKVILVLLALALLAAAALLGKKPVWNTLVLVLIFGCFMAVLNPVGDSPDEMAHYLRAEALSQGRIFTGATVPLDADKSLYTLFNDASTEKNQFYKFSDAFMYPLRVGDGTAQTLTGTSGNYIFFAYLASALGLRLARAMHLSAMVCVYLCRVLNVCVYAALAALAVHLAPHMKRTFAFMACFPFCVYLAASFNSDLVTFGLALVLSAWLYRLWCAPDGSVGLRELGIYALLAMMLALTKIPYIIFLPLVLLLPRARYRKKTYLWWSLGFLAAAGLVCLVWLALSGAAGLRPAEGANAGQQLHFILQHPARVVNTVLTAFFQDCLMLYQEWYTLGWLTYNFAWVGLFVPVVFFFLVTSEPLEERSVLSTRAKTGMALLTAAVVPLTYLAMYISTMYVGASTIIGIQGRYVLPCMTMLPLLLARPNPAPQRLMRPLTAPLWNTGMLVVCISCIVLRHYL